jgi:hypothetical protein
MIQKILIALWVVGATSVVCLAHDKTNTEARSKHAAKLAAEFHEKALEWEQKADQETDQELAGVMREMAALRLQESEAQKKLSEALRKRQWSSITRFEKQSSDLCHKVGSAHEKFEKLHAKKKVEKPSGQKKEIPDKSLDQKSKND